MIKRWIKKSSELIHREYGKEMRAVNFYNPESKKEERFILFYEPDWSLVLPVTADGKVIVTKQYRHGVDRIVLELPMGVIAKGETPRQAAIRELKEETGYQAGKVIKLGEPMAISAGNSWTRGHLFLALNCKKKVDQKLDESENIEIQAIPLNRWLGITDRIIDGGSLTATLRALSYLKSFIS